MPYSRKYKYLIKNKKMPKTSYYRAIKSKTPINNPNTFYATNFVNINKRNSEPKSDKILKDSIKEPTILVEVDEGQQSSKKINFDENYLCTIESSNRIDDLEENNFDLIPTKELKNIINFETSEFEVAAVMLSTFYAANLTQHAFSIVSDLIRGITAIDVPLNYDSCAQMVLRKFNHSISYKKTLYCKECKNRVEIINLNKQRFCNICNKKYFLNLISYNFVFFSNSTIF